jgi:hypothetical protein
VDKKEKYYNYIADDLNTKVEFFYDYYKMGFPWEPVWWSKVSDGTEFPMGSIDIGMWRLSFYIPSSTTMDRFTKYIGENYGAKEEESEIIYNLFREKLLKRI